MKNKTLLLGFTLLFLIVTILVLSKTTVLFSTQVSLPDPAAIYCNDLGYKYEIITNPDGSQYGICKLPHGLECDAWKFFQGKCKKEYTYCEKRGGKIITTNTGCSFSSECAICILPDGTKCDEWKLLKGECP